MDTANEQHQMPTLGELKDNNVSGAASPLQACLPEAIIQVIGDLLEKTAKPPSDSNHYRRLQTSGVIPIPAGKDQLEAHLTVEACDKSVKEKRMRILESLKGPALENIKAVRFNNPDATPVEYIEVIENTCETGEDL